MGKLEDLQKLDDSCQSVLNLITQAEQGLEQAHTIYEEWTRTHKGGADQPNLMTGIKALRDQIHILTDDHNRLVGQIHQLQQETAQEPDDNPY